MDIEELLPDGEWKTSEEYVIRCPICSDHPTHNHCHVNVEKGVFFCHYEGCRGTLKRLLKKLEIIGELEPRKGITEKEQYEPIDFERFPRVRGHAGELDKMAYDYLNRRGLSSEEIVVYGFRFSRFGRFYGYVLLPIEEDGKVVNFVGRSFISAIKPKYLYPHTGETLITSNEAIFGYEEARRGGCAAVMITEGIFDAIAANRIVGLRGLAILSSHLSKGQFNKLLRLSKSIDFFVVLDSDAHKKAIEITKRLWAEGRKVKIVLLEKGDSGKKDPASISEDELTRALDEAEPYSFYLKYKILKND